MAPYPNATEEPELSENAEMLLRAYEAETVESVTAEVANRPEGGTAELIIVKPAVHDTGVSRWIIEAAREWGFDVYTVDLDSGEILLDRLKYKETRENELVAGGDRRADQ